MICREREIGMGRGSRAVEDGGSGRDSGASSVYSR